MRRSLTYALCTLAVALVALVALARPSAPIAPPVVKPTPPIVKPTPPIVKPTPPIVKTDPPATPPTDQQPKQQPKAQPQVEIVFALDTTSSMSGLIDGAKRTIWSLVNFVSSAQPKPHVRIGLVAYRDLGDTYVTRFYDLSDDIDAVFAHLLAFRAEGGGDTPEHVAKGLHDAIQRTSWSKGRNVARIVYLVGDAPPHTDYQDGYDVDKLARLAAARGIHVNTIRCGSDTDAGAAFQRIARLGKGRYSSIAQDGGVARAETPYDARLAELNRKLIGTTVGYGAGGGRAASAKMEAIAAAPAPAAADRAVYAARHRGVTTSKSDLVAAMESEGAASVTRVAKDELPPELAPLSPEARVAYVKGKAKERKAVMAEIESVAAERSAYLKKAAPTKGGGFDERVRQSLQEQTAGLLAF